MNILLLLFFAWLGAIVASFAGVVAERLHTGTSFVTGRSRCNSCRRTLSVLDLFPVVGWLLSFGRCRTCGSRVPYLYPLVEAVLAFLFVLSYMTLSWSYALLFFLVSLTLLTIIVLYDLRHTVVPWKLSIPFFVCSLLFALASDPGLVRFSGTLFLAGAIGMGFFLLHVLSKGRAMGLGDAPIAFSLSLLVGRAAFPGLLFSFWIGAIVGILILVKRRGGPRMGIEVPFVPFLAVGYLLAYFTQWSPFVFL